MEELTVSELSEKLDLLPVTVKKRLQKNRLKPVRYVGITAIYDPSVADIIKTSAPVGRPKKPKRDKKNGKD
jgi:hypothetical protein